MTLPALLLLNLLAPFVMLGVLLRFLFSSRRGLLRDLPEELCERAGGLPLAARRALAGRRVLWVHAASAGEVAAVDELLRRVKARPGAPAVLLTTMTRAGREAARKLAQVDAAALAPVDCWPAARRFLAAARPYALLLVETELWPNLIECAGRSGLAVGLVNGRVSQRSFPRYRLAAPLLRPFLARISRLAVQTEEDARRFAALGAAPESIAVAGNMKYDRMASRGEDEAVASRLRRMGWDGLPLFVAGSTHPGEHEQVLAAFRQARAAVPGLRLVLAPRHIEKAAAVEQALAASGLSWSRWSEPEAPGGDCLLLDAMGLLRSFYAHARAAFVGGSLVPVGGHNLLEPALAGAPVLFGPHVGNTRQAADQLTAAGCGFLVEDEAALGRRLQALLDERLGERAREFARGLCGATERTLSHLAPVLSPSGSGERLLSEGGAS